MATGLPLGSFKIAINRQIKFINQFFKRTYCISDNDDKSEKQVHWYFFIDLIKNQLFSGHSCK